MTQRSIVLLGGPDSGKTNYLGRLWPSFKKRKGVLRAERLPDNIAYVDRAVEHLMRGSFAPRSDRNLEVGRVDFSITVRGANGEGAQTELMVPDISGELWTRTVATFEIPQEWLDVLNQAAGAIVFVRALSDQNVKPLDWVAARNILRLDADKPVQPQQPLPAEEAQGAIALPFEPDLPTQVLLCELLRYLDLNLMDRIDGARPRVSVIVAAYDLLDSQIRAGGPMAYLKREFPLFAGRLADTGRLELKLFGLSVVGGDLKDDDAFRSQFLDRDITEQGWVVVEDRNGLRTDQDVTLPIAWAMGD